MNISTGDQFMTLFETSETCRYNPEERLAFLQGYHDAWVLRDPERPLSLLPKSHKPPLRLEETFHAGQIKVESDLEDKEALDAATIAAIIASI